MAVAKDGPYAVSHRMNLTNFNVLRNLHGTRSEATAAFGHSTVPYFVRACALARLFGTEHIPNPAHSPNELQGEVIVDLRAQPTDRNLYDIGVAVEIHVPYI